MALVWLGPSGFAVLAQAWLEWLVLGSLAFWAKSMLSGRSPGSLAKALGEAQVLRTKHILSCRSMNSLSKVEALWPEHRLSRQSAGSMCEAQAL